jgi:hypothetical protein
MRYVSALPLLLLLGSGVMSGQNNTAKAGDSTGTVYKVPLQIQKTDRTGENFKLSGQTSPSQFQPSAPASPDSCPVSLRAQRQGQAVTRYARDQQPEPMPTQWLEVTFFNSQARNVVSALLKVHGYGPSARMMPADSAQRESQEIEKNVDMKISVLGQGRASTELTMRHFAAVSRIDIEELEFADGTSWKASETGACSFTPNLFMLVSNR